jgi:hypothetical protein
MIEKGRIKSLFSILRAAYSLDVFDLNFVYSNEGMKTLEWPSTSLKQKGYLKRVAAFVRDFFNEVRFSVAKKKRPVKIGESYFFVHSQNQKNAVINLFDSVVNPRLIELRGKNKNFGSLWIYFLSVLFIPTVAFRYFNASKYQKSSFAYCLDDYLKIQSLYVSIRLYIRKHSPAVLILSNDHNMENRIFLKAFNDERIPTVYIQHASVSDSLKFPVLNFKYALLEGNDALRKYEKWGITGCSVFLVGTARYDKYAHLANTNTCIKHVCICMSSADKMNRVKELIYSLRYYFPDIDLMLRPHPADRRGDELKKIVEKYNLGFSDARKEVSFEMLNKVDAIISGDSNILLEAALMNVYPVRYELSDMNTDAYGFIRDGLVTDYFTEIPPLIERLTYLKNKKPEIRKKAKWYSDNIDTAYEGSASRLCSEIINGAIEKKEINKSVWNEPEVYDQYKVYTLRQINESKPATKLYLN